MDQEPVNILAVDMMSLLVRDYFGHGVSAVRGVTGTVSRIATMAEKFHPRTIVVADDRGYTHRTALLPTYKAVRTPLPDDLRRQVPVCRRVLSDCGCLVVGVDGYEADDVLASVATRHPGVVVVSADKDLLAVGDRARIYEPWNGGRWVTAQSRHGVSPERALDYLSLCGDQSDNVPGVRGIGPTWARKLVSEYGRLEDVIRAAETGVITGRIGRLLTEGRASAFLSRDVMTLVDDLPLPEMTPWWMPAACPDAWYDVPCESLWPSMVQAWRSRCQAA